MIFVSTGKPLSCLSVHASWPNGSERGPGRRKPPNSAVPFGFRRTETL
jgi:hypothetical protein